MHDLESVRHLVKNGRKAMRRARESTAGEGKAARFAAQFQTLITFVESWPAALGTIEHGLVVLAYEDGLEVRTRSGLPGLLLASLAPMMDRRTAAEWRKALRWVLSGELTVADVQALGLRGAERHYRTTGKSKAQRMVAAQLRKRRGAK